MRRLRGNSSEDKNSSYCNPPAAQLTFSASILPRSTISLRSQTHELPPSRKKPFLCRTKRFGDPQVPSQLSCTMPLASCSPNLFHRTQFDWEARPTSLSLVASQVSAGREPAPRRTWDDVLIACHPSSWPFAACTHLEQCDKSGSGPGWPNFRDKLVSTRGSTRRRQVPSPGLGSPGGGQQASPSSDSSIGLGLNFLIAPEN